MPFGRPQDPDLDDLIVHVVNRALGRDAALTKTKLVKLLYLTDIARSQDGRRLLTGLEWTFFHYGPYAFELEQHLDRMAGNQLDAKERGGTLLYVGAPDADTESWPDSTRLLVDRIVDRWAAEPLNLLLDYVYFETEPMIDANRGDRLDFDLVTSPSLAKPNPGQIRPDVREKLHALAAARQASRSPLTSGRHDEIWKEAMAHEAQLDGSPLTGLVGERFRFTDAAAKALISESEGG